MDVSHRPTGVLRFGIFEADLDAGELRKNGVKMHLQDQPFQVLIVLLNRPGQVVRREELRSEVWPEDTFVEFDQALNTAVKKIRIALGDDANAPRYVETIPRRGYRFIAEVSPRVDLSGPGVMDVVSEARISRSFSFASRRVIAGVFAAVGIFVMLGFLIAHRTQAARGQTQKRIVLAVLPFENWSDGARQASLCDGITEELISQLSRTDPARLEVAAHTTVRQYGHTSRTVAQIGSELHADYLMEGSLRSDRQHVRVSAELIRVSDQARVWGDDFDREDGDLLTLERDIATSISAKVKAKMLPGSAE
jgi:TolB-like protein/DNA-binding winged helix-turn-helix (wHTH) protein